MKNFTVIAGVAILCGCSTPCPPKIIKIDSEPQGARVFLGLGANDSDAMKTRNYLGKTPLDWEVPADMIEDCRYFQPKSVFIYSSMVPPATIFFADPPTGATNLFPKTQVFHTGTMFTPSDPIPIGIFFDLTKP